jgi:acyl carrier protein
MSQTITDQDARTAVADAVVEIVPDADLDTLGEDEPIRDAFELDSMDFLTFVELLSGRTGVRIDESDYPELTTMADCVSFLTRRAG